MTDNPENPRGRTKNIEEVSEWRLYPVGGGESWLGFDAVRGLDEVPEDIAPIGRAAQPKEVTSPYVMLASNEASFIIGATVAVTGGRPFI